jgi:hypothetical protein
VGEVKEVMCLTESDPDHKTTEFREAKHITTESTERKSAEHRKRI